MLKRDLDTSRTLYEGLLEKMKEAGINAGLRSTASASSIPPASPPRLPNPNIPRIFLCLRPSPHLGSRPSLPARKSRQHCSYNRTSPEHFPTAVTRPHPHGIPLRNHQRRPPPGYRPFSRGCLNSSPRSSPSPKWPKPTRPTHLAPAFLPRRFLPRSSSLLALYPRKQNHNEHQYRHRFGQKGVRVLLIDADMRRPSVHKTLDLPGPLKGLSNVLTGTASIPDAITTAPQLPNLWVLPAGSPPPNPAELLASTNMRTMLSQLREQYDHIVIDTPQPLRDRCGSSLHPRRCRSPRNPQRPNHQTALRRSRDLLTQVNAASAASC